MEPFIIALSVLQTCITVMLVVVVLKRRAALAPPVDTHGERLARAALASARQMHPDAHGDDLLRKAIVVFRELDLGEDNKRDYTDRQAAFFIRAVL